MPRKPRIHYPGALYHVMLRGNGGANIFLDDQDRSRFLLLLQQVLEKFSVRILAFCLMDNHIHLALQVGDIPLSRIMQNLSFRYTQWFNRRRKMTGHLFQGRFKAILVEADSYLLQLIAYIHLNPVRAGIADSPEQFRWSSHRAYLGTEAIPWLSSDYALATLSPQGPQSRKLYAELVQNEAPKGHRKEFHGTGSLDTRILGQDDFLLETLQNANQAPLHRPGLKDIIQVICEHFSCAPEELCSPGQSRQLSRIRTWLAWFVLEHSWATLTELGQFLGRDGSTLSSAISRLKEKARQDREISATYQTLQSKLTDFQA